MFKATDQINASVTRVNGLGLSINTNAQDGYKKNCAAAVGRWEALFKCLNTPSVEYPYLDASTESTTTAPLENEAESPPIAVRSAFSRVSSSSSWSSEADLSSDFDDVCPDLTGASPSSSYSSLGDFPSPDPSLRKSPAFLDKLLKKGYSHNGLGVWGAGGLPEEFNVGNTPVESKPLSITRVAGDEENKENRPPSRSSNFDRPDSLLIPNPQLRGKRVPFGTLYDSQLESLKTLSRPYDPFGMGAPELNSKRKVLAPSRTLSPVELVRLERLHEQAKCIDDWSWAFEDAVVDAGAGEMESGRRVSVCV